MERVLFIKELELQGFKSFANRTQVPFQHAVTAVVGPNGCGKSNILDSIKWVLGEKSVKSIRGEKMEDLIFSGTDTQKAAGYTQVTLTMDNREKILSLDAEEVRIGRRMYRDGQSQYFLNDIRVARREIENLLMDTGLGKSSYSFMEQGQMDMILSSKPAERRKIFEEAAGVSRFKSQQEEAQKNLESTNVNLTRIHDIQHELERELKVKKIQAEKTQEYNRLKAEHKEHDLRIRFLTIKEMEKNLQQLQEKLQKKIAEREKAGQKTFQYEEQILLLEKEKEEKQKELHEKDVVNQISREKISRWENDLNTFLQKRKQLKEEADQLRALVTKLDQRVKALKKEMHSQNQLTLNLDVQIQGALQTKEEIEKKILRLDEEREDNQEELQQVLMRQKENLERLKELRSDLQVVIQELLQALKHEKDKWQKENEERKKMQKEVNAGLLLLQEQLDKLYKKNSQKPNVQEMLNDLETCIHNTPFQKWRQAVEEAGNISEGLTHLLFDRGGVHARKEELDELIAAIEKENENLENRKQALQEKSESLREEKTLKITQKESLLGEIKSFYVTKDSLKEKEKNLSEQMKNDESHLQYLSGNFNRVEGELIQLDEKEQSVKKDIGELQAGIAKEIAEIKNLEKKIESIDTKKEKNVQLIAKEKEKNKQIFEETNDLEVKIGTSLGVKESFVQEIFNDYNLTFGEVEEKLNNSRIQLDSEKNKLNELQKNMEVLGSINPLAVEELRSVEEYYNHNQTQLEDILAARSHIEAVIQEIQEKSEQMFLQTFKQVQENFQTIFQKLFNGGNASLSLLEENDPLQSGIEIQVQPPGKKPRSLRMLSGGEKALTAISLMFAIYMVRSSPFCVLDEIDAPLDDQNVIRFLNLLDDFSQKTQFILITHNKKTMTKANAVFGVTMDDPGVSRLLAVEVKAV